MVPFISKLFFVDNMLSKVTIPKLLKVTNFFLRGVLHEGRFYLKVDPLSQVHVRKHGYKNLA
jgi:hypothetical protein